MTKTILIGCLVGVFVALGTGSASAGSIVFTDPTFNLLNYTPTPLFLSNPNVVLTASQCSSCGNPGSALDFFFSVPYVGTGSAELGVINNGWSYNPSAQGAITSSDVSVDKT